MALPAVKKSNIFTDLALAAIVMSVLGILIVPLPTFVLDFLIICSFALAFLILLVSLFIVDPLEFASYPSLLLVTTMFRLCLMIAVSRSILLHAEAGEVVHSFADFVVGGNYVVGLIIFLILILVNFIVVTEGAKRVAEVAARFTLDAMPGKQMSIDADFNAGLIDAEMAKKRRKDLERAANFFGTMDGANKFVRGDVIAGIVIMVINILGGFLVGVFMLGMELVDAIARYTLLTIGGGLVDQLPGLIIAMSAGFLTTKETSDDNLATNLRTQLFGNYKTMAIAGVFLVGLSLVPGLPGGVFRLIGIALASVAFLMFRRQQKSKAVIEEEDETIAEQEAKKPENVLQVMEVQPLTLEMGLDLIPLVDPAQGGDLLDRIVPMRVQIAMELGFVMPGVQFKDNLNLRPNSYRILVKGLEVASGEILMGYMLAIQQPDTDLSQELVGFPTADPAFGTPAVWVTGYEAQRAAQLGYMVTDPSNVVLTHLTEVVKNYSHEILSRQEVQVMLNKVKEKAPVVVKELIPDMLGLGDVQRVLQNLLRERVTIRDLSTILERLADFSKITKDPDILTELVRQSMSRQICANLADDQGVIPVITLDPKVEQAISESIQQTSQGTVLALNPQIGSQILAKLANEVQTATQAGNNPVILSNPQIRPHVKRLTDRNFPTLTVISYSEIAPKFKVQSIGTVTISLGVVG